MDAKDFLVFASFLVENVKDKSELKAVSCRSAISRSYYACFHVAQAIIKEHYSGKWPSGGTAHKAIEDILNYSEDSELKKASQIFKSLRENRRTADYDLHVVSCENVEQVQLHLELASTFIKIMSRSESEDVVARRMLVQGLQIGSGTYNKLLKGR